MSKALTLGLLFAFCLLLSCAGVEKRETKPDAKPKTSKFVLLSSTIGPIDAGIVDALETEFERETGVRVRHVGAGTGAALDIAKQGSVDLVLVHAKSLEEKFV